MTQPESHDDNPLSVVTLPPAQRDSGKADDADLVDDGQMLVTREPYQPEPVTTFLASLRDDIGEQNFQHWFHKRTRFNFYMNRINARNQIGYVCIWKLDNIGSFCK